MVSHGEGTLRQFCKAGIWLNEGRAHWFDNIDDALREYKKSQLEHHLNSLLAQLDMPANQEQLALEIEKTKQRQSAILALESGMKGAPVIVDHEEGLRVGRSRYRGEIFPTNLIY